MATLLLSCMPTFKFFKGGKELTNDKLEGASKETLKNAIKKLK
jgi:hypothetical protein